MIDLSVITVSYNSELFIRRYLDSLKFLPDNSEVIIIDSGSTDNTVSLIKEYLKKPLIKNYLSLIEVKENIGFGRGNNLAAQKAKGEYLFFLNPDTELVMKIDDLVKFYKNNSDVGLLGPKLMMPNGKIQPSVKKISTIWGAFKEYVLGIKGSYSEYIPDVDVPAEVESIYGAAMLVSKGLFNNVRGFDEKFFLYYEDMDFCRKVRRMGKKIYYFPKVKIMHLVGGTKSEKDRYQLNLKSASLYHGRFGSLILQMIFWVPRLRRRLALS